tara:strand:+ start:14499 stop:14840 length:342 start_codon:yes stop_codon:yes gene_type:complete
LAIVRSRKLLNGARNQSCVNCGATGTVVAAHYTGLRSYSFGKGRGIKPHDICTADLCYKCHNAFDTNCNSLTELKGDFPKRVDRSEQFLFLIMQTIIRRIDQGLIKIGDSDED